MYLLTAENLEQRGTPVIRLHFWHFFPLHVVLPADLATGKDWAFGTPALSSTAFSVTKSLLTSELLMRTRLCVCGVVVRGRGALLPQCSPGTGLDTSAASCETILTRANAHYSNLTH